MIISDVMTKDVKFIDENETVGKAVSLMRDEHVKELPVVSKGVVVGLINFNSIVNATSSGKLKVGKIAFKTPVLNPDDDLLGAVNSMRDAGVHGLPVVKGGLLVGFVSDYDIIKIMKSEFSRLTVNDLMRDVPPVLSLDDNMGRARRLFSHDKVTSLPVVDANGKLSRVVTESDLFDLFKPLQKMGFGFRGQGGGESISLMNAKIRDLVVKSYSAVLVGEKLVNAIDLMISNHLTSLIIVDDANEPIGYLDRFELVKHLYRERKPRGVLLTFSGLSLDYPTNALLTKVVTDHLARVNYLAKSIGAINVRIKGLHAGSGVRKFELDLKVILSTGVSKSIKKVGYAIRECLDEALTDVEKIMKKDYKKTNP